MNLKSTFHSCYRPINKYNTKSPTLIDMNYDYMFGPKTATIKSISDIIF